MSVHKDAAPRDVGDMAAEPSASSTRHLAQGGTHHNTRAVIAASSGVVEDLEQPWDLLLQITNMSTLMSMLRVGYELEIFKALAAGPEPRSVYQLRAPTGADGRLVLRVLRCLAANGFVAEAGPGVFVGTKTTRLLANPVLEGAVSFQHGAIAPSFHELPAFVRKRGFKDPPGPHCAFNRWAGSGLGIYGWLETQPRLLRAFQDFMTLPRPADWLDCISMADVPDGPVFVDVGGGEGQQCAHVLAKHGELAGRVILQDLQEAIDSAPGIEGVVTMAHDFFTPQPVKASRYYYLRYILHNWEDDKAVEILRNLRPAMGPASQILIDEMVMPASGALAWHAVMDLIMMTAFGGRERTLEEWAGLLDQAGLEIRCVSTYDAVMQTCVIVAQLKRM